MKRQFTSAFMLLALFSFLITSCTKENTTSPNIKFDQTYKILNVGTNDTLKITVDPSSIPITSFTMSSSDTSIATVNARGVISAKAPGNATITAESSDGSSANCYVTVAKWTYYNSKNSGLTYDYIDDLTVDSQNNIWCVSHVLVKGGLAEFNGTKWNYYYPPNSDLHGNKIKTDKNGNVWASSWGYGVYKFDGTTWTEYKSNSYLSPDITSIGVDSQNNIWLGNWRTGVAKFDGTTWAGYTNNTGLASDTVQAIAVDSHDNVWIGTNNGLSEFDGSNWTTYNSGNGLPENDVYGITTDLQGNIWVSTWLGVSKFDGSNWTTYAANDHNLGSAAVTSMAVDAQNNIWFCSVYGVTKFDGTRWIKYPMEKGYYEITSIAIDSQGNKWLGTWGGGVVKLQD